ncbi:MAG: hypothetical protein PVH05_00425 [Burkholderiales bacterium]
MKPGKTKLVSLVVLTLVIVPVGAWGAEPHECLQFTRDGTEGAKFTNICNEMVNVMYCVDNPQSPKTCSAERIGITTLVPLSKEIVPEYAVTGEGEIYSAACFYPTAPVGWKPGPDSPFTCKKTCVMC